MLNNSIATRIGFGGVKLSVMPSLKSALNILETAFDNGIKYFDTAPLYGSGYSEKIIGKFARHKRDKIIIASKAGLNPGIDYTLNPSVALPLNYIKRMLKKKPAATKPVECTLVKYRQITKDYLQSSFEKTLKNLQTDYIDNYLLHEALPSFLDDDAYAYLLDLKSKKLVHNIGIATSGINFIDNTSWDILQYEYSENSKNIYDAHPEKKHILHSILSNAYSENIPVKNAGYLIADCLRKTNADVILFSTSSSKHLLENIASINKFS